LYLSRTAFPDRGSLICILITPSIRFAPPLVIDEADLKKSIDIILKALDDFDVVS
jgi:acetylornithine/succinyldiaminopimelate/putrescine aminotransferase